MSQSFVQIYLHIVFSTKHRAALLQDEPLRKNLHAYLGGTCRNLDAPSLAIGGVEDHVHVLCRLSKMQSVSDLIRELKRDSSKWVKEQDSKLNAFYWQHGYGAFSISPSHVEALKEYIRNQEEHHRIETFQEELRRLCRKYGLALDEQYAWE